MPNTAPERKMYSFELLTIGAIRTCPVWITRACTTFLKICSMAGALLRTHRLQYFTVVTTPSRVTMALTMDTHTMAGTGWI